MNKLGWIAFAVLALVSAVGLGAKHEVKTDEQTAVLLRIEQLLINQNHRPKYGPQMPFDHSTMADLCDGGAFCALVDKTQKAPGFWKEKEPAFLEALEKAKSKDFCAKYQRHIEHLREEALKDVDKGAEKKKGE